MRLSVPKTKHKKPLIMQRLLPMQRAHRYNESFIYRPCIYRRYLILANDLDTFGCARVVLCHYGSRYHFQYGKLSGEGQVNTDPLCIYIHEVIPPYHRNLISPMKQYSVC